MEVVGAWWKEMRTMNGVGDVGDGNGLASVTGTPVFRVRLTLASF